MKPTGGLRGRGLANRLIWCGLEGLIAAVDDIDCSLTMTANLAMVKVLKLNEKIS